MKTILKDILMDIRDDKDILKIIKKILKDILWRRQLYLSWNSFMTYIFLYLTHKQFEDSCKGGNMSNSATKLAKLGESQLKIENEQYIEYFSL